MKSTSMVLALAAGSTIAVGAMAAEPQLATGLAKVGSVGHMYINMRTGERIVTTGQVDRALSNTVWNNMDNTNNGNFFWGMDNATNAFPDGTPGPRVGSEALDWGDIGRHLTAPATASVVDCYRVSYATGVIGGGVSITDPVVGFSIINAWYDDESGFSDTTFTVAQAIQILDIPGGDPLLPPGNFAGWILTVDLAGTSLVFTLDGADEDLGGTHDFGFSYGFEQNQVQALGTTGPFLILPGETGPEGLGFPTGGALTSTSYGVEDVFDWFRAGPANGGPLHDNLTMQGSFFFGGWIPGIPVTDPLFTPYASWGMELFSPGGAPVCPADCNGDGVVDVLDFFAFVGAFAGGVATTPCPDNNGDGVVDVLDFFAFVGQFAAGCP